MQKIVFFVLILRKKKKKIFNFFFKNILKNILKLNFFFRIEILNLIIY